MGRQRRLDAPKNQCSRHSMSRAIAERKPAALRFQSHTIVCVRPSSLNSIRARSVSPEKSRSPSRSRPRSCDRALILEHERTKYLSPSTPQAERVDGVARHRALVLDQKNLPCANAPCACSATARAHSSDHPPAASAARTVALGAPLTEKTSRQSCISVRVGCSLMPRL